MKPKVIIYKKVDQEVLDYIQETCDVVYFEGLDSQNHPKFLQELKNAQGILGSGLKVDKTLLDQAPQLKIVCNSSVGYDNLDVTELSNRGIMAYEHSRGIERDSRRYDYGLDTVHSEKNA